MVIAVTMVITVDIDTLDILPAAAVLAPSQTDSIRTIAVTLVPVHLREVPIAVEPIIDPITCLSR